MLEALANAPTVHTTGINPESVATILGGLVALLGLAGVAYRKFIAPGRILDRQRADEATRDMVLAAVRAEVGPVLAQTKNNGGSSMKDDLDRQLSGLGRSMDRQFAAVNTHLAQQDEHLTRLDGRVDALHDQRKPPS